MDSKIKEMTQKKKEVKRRNENSEHPVKSKKVKIEEAKMKDSGKNVKELEQSSMAQIEVSPKVELLKGDAGITFHFYETDKREVILLAHLSKITTRISGHIIRLLKDDATIPFMIRYRKHLIGEKTADQLRNIKKNYDTVKKIIHKGAKIKASLEVQGHLTEKLLYFICTARSMEELEFLYEPFKVAKRSKLRKIIDLNLVPEGEKILHGGGYVDIQSLSQQNQLESAEIQELLIYYVTNTVSKDAEILSLINSWTYNNRFILKCNENKGLKKSSDEAKQLKKLEDFSNYYNFSRTIAYIKPYQILAINRGETNNFLKVRIIFPHQFKNNLFKVIERKWLNRGCEYPLRKTIFNDAMKNIYSQRVVPFLKRVIRRDLKKKAEKAALQVFSENVKYLLLTPPIRGVTVLAIDPGLSSGCKIAILNPRQHIIHTSYLFLHKEESFSGRNCRLVNLVKNHRVDLIAIGNGLGGRDVELKVTTLMEKNYIEKNVYYILVNECGISPYSCSQEALNEYTGYEPNIISAISLAKRVLDPLCEYVKADAKNLGVGMYQHDTNEKKLNSTLEEVISDCVSNVGVDINSAPLILLKRVAGLSESKATILVERREKDGPFLNRNQLLKIKGIGPKTFQQCSGFIKILPETLPEITTKMKSTLNILDQTIIHPEDYTVAKSIIALSGLEIENIGKKNFIEKFKSFLLKKDKHKIAKELQIPFETLQLIIEALTKPADYDLRASLEKPLFKKGLKYIEDLKINDCVSGQVKNVTPFGVFIDIGLQWDGLASSKFDTENVHVGQKVEVEILQFDYLRKRITLKILRIIPVGEM